jgi:hypothetical protein
MMTNELTTITDGFDANAHDPAASPIRGGGWKFKDGDYYSFTDQIDVHGASHAVLDIRQGWQKLAEGCPPEYLMREHGKPRPPQPHVDEKDWPIGLSGNPEHPWRLTWYLYLLNTATGETSTFWTNTIGGNIAVGELSDQVSNMRQMRPRALPVIALESRDMPTRFGGTKPRPYFRLLGWRERSDPNAPAQLSGPESKAPGEALEHSATDATPAKGSTKVPKGAVLESVTTSVAGRFATYRGHDIKPHGGHWIISKDGKELHRVDDEAAARAWINDVFKKASPQTNKRGVTRFDSPELTPIEEPSTEEVFSDEIPF